MAEFTLDTSGCVIRHDGAALHFHDDLTPFAQGYAATAILAALDDVRVVSERADLSIAKGDEAPTHWTVFPSGDNWTPLGQFETEEKARAYVASLARFDRLSPEALALILRDCEAHTRTRLLTVFSDEQAPALHNMGGVFWRHRQMGVAAGFPPLTPTLGDDGKVYLREAGQ